MAALRQRLHVPVIDASSVQHAMQVLKACDRGGAAQALPEAMGLGERR